MAKRPFYPRMTAQEAVEIRIALAEGATQRSLAQEYCVSTMCIGKIARRETHIEAGGPVLPYGTPRLDPDDHARIVELLDEGYTVSEVQRIIGCSRCTVYYWHARADKVRRKLSPDA